MQSNRRIERYVAPLDETPIAAVDAVDTSKKASSVWGDAWKDMRGRWLTWVCLVLILLIAAVAIFPELFAKADPTSCDTLNSVAPAIAGHPFGFDVQGCDVYARVIYGARASVIVGLLATILATLLGGVIGAIAGYYGGWLDSVVSRLGDIFFAIPTVLGAIVVMQMMPWDKNAMSLAIVLAIFGWPQVARIMRGAVLSTKHADFVTASIALGVSRSKILLKHVVPNALAPVIVIATVSLGTYIVAEATLSFLGVGLPPSMISWGHDISVAQDEIRTTPTLLIYPATALALTVMAFLLLGDIVRDALDPKARARR
ncbi:ABC transporter permease [Galactobacter caseinivorans]|uniref:ABC transporter permease n=1 Tax=Galactobacter caseinivorans TaxID=2676123 RepID=A0A496PM20_9MICC|nr:ABC transporter permease [Galactobacter caseinivorans]RKW71572.1 ABC transporter permease [Galactobacter caseinivorans]